MILTDVNIDALENLCHKYSGRGPRYTSYPTAIEFHSGFGKEEWTAALQQEFLELNATPVSLYLHLPFCTSLCYFCACNKIITRDRSVTAPYLKLLRLEFEQYQRTLAAVSCDLPSLVQIHWGGGTPNFLTPEEMIELSEMTSEFFPEKELNAEISVELDPRVCTPEHLDALRSVGFNRVSFGVQDFTPHVQEIVNRIQPFEQTAELCAQVRKRAFSSINIDLIYGLPGQTRDGFCRTVSQVIQLRPERIALYGYAHVTWIQKVQRALEREHLPTPEERIALFIDALTLLSAAGYVYVGLDHFALPDDELARAVDNQTLRRNFMGYSTHRGSRILGLGVSSISTLNGAFAQNTKDMESYRAALESGTFPTERGCKRSKDDLLRGEIIELLMCQGKLDIPVIEQIHSIDFWEYFSDVRPALSGFVEEGLMEITGGALILSPLGRVFSRNIAMSFDAYLQGHVKSEKPVFSQAV